MARPKINSIKVEIFAKNGRLAFARTFARGDIKGGAWVAGGGNGSGQASWVGIKASISGMAKQLAAGAESAQKAEGAEKTE